MNRCHPCSSPFAAVLFASAVSTISGGAWADGQSAVSCSDSAAQGRPHLTVTAVGARRVTGNITFTLYGDQPSRFLAHHGAIAVQRTTLTGPIAQTCFAVAAPGTYAIAIYHDANNNHRFDRTLVGLPAEGYGFSNDAPALLGLPSYSAVKFAVPAGETRLTIRLRY